MPAPLLSALSLSGAPLGEVEFYEVGPCIADAVEERLVGRAECEAIFLEAGTPPSDHDEVLVTDVDTAHGGCSSSEFRADVQSDAEGVEGPRSSSSELRSPSPADAPTPPTPTANIGTSPVLAVLPARSHQGSFTSVFAPGDEARMDGVTVLERPNRARVASADQQNAGRCQSQASPGSEESKPRHRPSECEEASALKKMLGSTVDRLTELIGQAKALNLTDEIHSVEKRLLSLFLLSSRDIRRDPAPRSSARSSSRTMSRSSSLESFFDEACGRDVARDAANLVLASTAHTPGEVTEPSTPRSVIHTPGGRPPDSRGAWLEAEPLEDAGPEISGEDVGVPSSDAPALPLASWHEPVVEDSSPSRAVAEVYADRLRENVAPTCFRETSGAASASKGVLGPRDGVRDVAATGESQFAGRPPLQLDRRVGMSVRPGYPPGFGFWHSSPFCISRTPNIRTPASHLSPARSPTSMSGYASPITGLPSGVASPNQRRSLSGYSSPAADRALLGSNFFVGTATAHSGLMHQLMSLREAREERDDDMEWSSEDISDDPGSEGPNLLDYLLKQAQSVSPYRGSKDPPHLCLDLSSEPLPCARRGLLPSRALPCLNAFLQALLPCAPLMHLFAQLSWHTLTKQRPAYACLVQVAFQFFGPGRPPGFSGTGTPSGLPAAAARQTFEDRANGGLPGEAPQLAPADPGQHTEPLLRKFERSKASTSSAGVTPPPETTALAQLVHFVLAQLHDECKWPTLSPNVGHYEDSPVTRIFGGLLERAPPPTGAVPESGVTGSGASVEPFLMLHVDLAKDPCGSVAEAVRRSGGGFARLPPFLLVHLQRFAAGAHGPTRVSRHCHIDMRLELEEATNCMLRTVGLELCSVVCHYGESPDGGSYKALARHGGGRRDAGRSNGSSGASAPGLDGWYVFDDTVARPKPPEELATVVQCEAYHVCFLVYRREDMKTVNIRPHAA